jgi:hypothetical protein
MDLDAWLVAISAAPALPGALCRNRSRIFDEQPHDPNGERNEHRALYLCSRCPALNDCRCWLATLPPSARPFGVVAGVVAHRAKQHKPKPSAPVPPMSAMRRRAMAAIAELEAHVRR